MAWSCDRAAIISEFFKTAREGILLGYLSADIGADDMELVLESSVGMSFGRTAFGARPFGAMYWATLDAGAWPIKVGSELILATQIGATLSVETSGRGYAGTAAAAHNQAVAVYEATFHDLVGAAVYAERMPRTWNNDKPAMLFEVIGGNVAVLAPIYRPNARCFCYSGNNAEYDCDVIYRLLSDLVHETDAGIVETGSGVVLSAIEEVEGQLLWDEDVKPERPFVMCSIAFEVRGK